MVAGASGSGASSADLVGALIASAMRLGLEPETDAFRASAELLETADGDGETLLCALQGLHLTRCDVPGSGSGERAAQLLRLALLRRHGQGVRSWATPRVV